MGLANQLSSFMPDLQQCTSNMRKLLSPKNEYIWTPTQEEEFKRSKNVLLSTKVVQPFNPAWSTVVLTDASRLNGIGFALVQYDPKRVDTKKRFALVQCGSSSSLRRKATTPPSSWNASRFNMPCPSLNSTFEGFQTSPSGQITNHW